MKQTNGHWNILNIVCAKVWGGGEQYVHDICESLSQMNATCFIACDSLYSGISERYKKVAQVLFFNLHSLNGLTAARQLADFIIQNHISALYCHSGQMMPLCLLLKRMTGITLILFKHNARLPKIDCYHKYMRKNTDSIICVSKFVYDMQTKGLPENEKAKFHLIYNGISLKRFSKYKTVKKQDGLFTVGYAGRITENKGISILVKAFQLVHSKHKDTCLRIAGAPEKNYLATVKKEISELHLNDAVFYEGVRSDMEIFYKEIDVFVFPSLVQEAFGLALCEAMFCKVPVISSNSGAQHEIVCNATNGFLLENTTPEALAEKILFVYKNPQDMPNLVAHAQKTVREKFTSEKTAEKLLTLLQDLKLSQTTSKDI